MKQLRTLLTAAALAVSGLAAGQAVAQNFVTNGSFETGLTGWTVTESVPQACVWETLSPPGNTGGVGGFPVPPPTDGAFVLMSDAGAPATCTLHQDVVLPAGQFFNIRLAAGYNYDDEFNPGGAGCSASVRVTTTGGAPIATVYSAGGPTSEPLQPRRPQNLPNVGGTTVRVILTAVACGDGPAGIVADNIVLAAGGVGLNVPTLSEWATLLLAFLMAGAAAVFLRKTA